MNANTLHEIVKDLPKAAWPSWVDEFYGSTYSYTLVYQHGQWNIQTAIGQIVGACHVSHAVLLFEASMTNWLVGGGFHCFEWDCGETDVTLPSLTLYDFGPFHGKTAVEMLAAACKAVSP